MRYFLLTLLLSIAVSVGATDKLVVEQSTGETAWSISTIKDLSFDGNGVKITFTDDTSVYYGKETLTMLKFSVTTGIDDLTNASGKISVQGNTIILNGVESDIKVYSLTGTLVAQGKGSQLDISSLTNGAYIVQADSLITKIIKR